MIGQDEKIIIKCDCGHPCFLEVDHWQDEGQTLWLSMYDQKSNFWWWFKQLWSGRVYHAEAVLSREDVIKLAKFLDKYAKEKHANKSREALPPRKEKRVSKKK